MAAMTHLTALRRIHAEFKNLTRLATPENPSDVADLLGELQFIETLIADWRKGLVVETDDAKGTKHKIVTTRSCKRTFNIDRIVVDWGQELDVTILQSMSDLVERDIIRVTGQWKKLTAAFSWNDIDLVIGSGDVTGGDLDAPHVGETWTEKRGVEAIKVGGE